MFKITIGSRYSGMTEAPHGTAYILRYLACRVTSWQVQIFKIPEREEFQTAPMSSSFDFWSKFRIAFNKMFFVPSMFFCLCYFSLLLCFVVCNYGIFDPVVFFFFFFFKSLHRKQYACIS